MTSPQESAATAGPVTPARPAAASAIGRPTPDDRGPRDRRHYSLLARDRRFGYPLEMVVRAAEAGWRIAETPVPYYPREGKSKVTGTLGGTVRTVRDMSRVLASITTHALFNGLNFTLLYWLQEQASKFQ